VLVVFEMNDMKKLLLEFKKNMLQESATTKYDDAIAVLKFFMENGVEAGTPEAQIVSQLQNALSFARQLDNSPGLTVNSPEEIVVAQRKISNKFVQEQIQNILLKMGMDQKNISGFVAYLKQASPEPEEITKARTDLEKREKEAEEKDSPEPVELGSGDIAPPKQAGTSIGRAGKRKSAPRPVTMGPEDSEIAARRARAQGDKTQP
jgi:hypothetical protein